MHINGGFTYLNPIYKDKEINNITVLDVNSLYPYCMRYKKLPISTPKKFEGKYSSSKVYDLYVQFLSCSFELKENHIPCIQIKKDKRFKSTEYLTSSNGFLVDLALTNIDLELFFENYDVYDLEYRGGYSFKSTDKIFVNYIDKWINIKIQADIDKNEGKRTLAKLMLNSLYGKFATTPYGQSKIPYLDNDEVVRYNLSDFEERQAIYLPVGIFITSYAREKTIKTIMAINDYSIKKYGKSAFIYADTDSCHTVLTQDELIKFCDIHSTKLGAWKVEEVCQKGKYIRAKTYIHETDNKIKIKCAGLPKNCYDQVTFENFKTGLVVYGKLQPIHIKGGIVLREREFTIKDDKIVKTIKSFKENRELKKGEDICKLYNLL